MHLQHDNKELRILDAEIFSSEIEYYTSVDGNKVQGSCSSFQFQGTMED